MTCIARLCNLDLNASGLPTPRLFVRCGAGPCTNGTDAGLSQYQTRYGIAFVARTEAMARLVAAEQMRLINDPTGSAIGEHVWRRYVPQAQAILILIKRAD